MLKLSPVYKDYIWGGEKLKALFGKAHDGIIAESWELSVHPDGQSTFDGVTLAEYLEQNPTAVDKKGSDLGILIKYIDAKTNLSVQVHPADDYARVHENDNGKTETWYIVDADDGAGIYCGLNQDVTPKQFLQAVNDGSVEKYLSFVPVKSGDCFLILPGTVHAICGGCVICEVQQSSNVTYRVYDYNRVDKKGNKRPLHVQKAMEVINFTKCNGALVQNPTLHLDGNGIRQLAKCKYFDCIELLLQGEYVIDNPSSFVSVNVLQGSGVIGNQSFVAGDTFFVPCGEKVLVKGNAKLLLTSK